MNNEEVKYGLAGVVADDTAISKVVPEINSLTYRGYKVQDLAAERSFEEVAYLLWYGDLPSARQRELLISEVREQIGLSDDVVSVMKKLNKNAHPMDALRTALSFVGQADNTANDSSPAGLLTKSVRMFAIIPELVAANFRLRQGKEVILSSRELGFAENFFYMCFGEVPAPEVVKCFDVSMTLYAEHSFNASTFTARTIASSTSDIYSAIVGAIGSLKGPLHGGANEAVMRMLKDIGSPEHVGSWVRDTLRNGERIMGFGHRVYRDGDSRVPTMTEAYRQMVDVIDTHEANQLWETSRTLADLMLEQKQIHPNLDFPAGPAYFLMGFEIPMFTPIFVMSRITGWTAHVIEQLANNKLVRPLSNYTGVEPRALGDVL